MLDDRRPPYTLKQYTDMAACDDNFLICEDAANKINRLDEEGPKLLLPHTVEGKGVHLTLGPLCRDLWGPLDRAPEVARRRRLQAPRMPSSWSWATPGGRSM